MVRVIILFAGFSLIWSSAFIVGKVAIAHLDPIVLLTVRFLLGSVCLLPFVLRQGGAFWRWPMIRFGAIAGLLNNALYLGLSFLALQTVPAPVLVVIISCAPVLTSAFAVASGQEPLNGRRFVGFVICIAGVACVAGGQPAASAGAGVGSDRGVMFSDGALAGYVMAIGGTVAFAFGTVFLRSRAIGASPVDVNFWQSLVGGLVLLPLAIFRVPDLRQWAVVFDDGPVLVSVLYLAIVITLGAMFLWLHLIGRFGASKAAAAHLINPLSGLVLSAVILGSDVSLVQVFGAVLIGFGLYIAVFHRRNRGNRGLIK